MEGVESNNRIVKICDEFLMLAVWNIHEQDVD